MKTNRGGGHNKPSHFIYQEIYEDTKKKLIKLCSADYSLAEKFVNSLSVNELHRKIIRPAKESETIKIDFTTEKINNNKITFLLEMYDSENNLLVFSRITEKINTNNMDEFKSILTEIINPTHEK